MNKKTFLRVWIISIALLLVSSSLICPNAKAQGGWGFPYQSGGSQYYGYGGGSSSMGYPSMGYSSGYPSMGYSSYPSGGYGGRYSMGYQSYPSGGYGANSLMSYPSYSFGGYGGNYSQIPMPVNISTPVAAGSTSSSTAVSGNSDFLEEFITGLQEKYPDLEGIDWEGWETWTDEDWQKLQDALSAERSAETLAQFKADMITKWDAYDLSAWEKFNTNWNTFIVDAAADENDTVGLTWTGFRATYGCFDTSDAAYGPNPDDVYCWKTYSLWADKQWKAFRGLYNKYLDHEWKTFYETLQTKMNDYNTVDWEDWRNWTDADWESCLTKVSSGSARLVTSATVTTSPSVGAGLSIPTWGYPGFSSRGYAGYYGASNTGYGASNIGYASFGGQTGGFSSAQTGGYGWGAPSMGYTGGWGGQTGYAGFGAQMGYGRW